MAKSAPQVSIVVVLYNSAKELRACLNSVREDVLSGFAELLVTDNASPDESAEIVGREFPEATLLRSETNRGFAGGCNFAWPKVRGRYWMLLNPDAVAQPGGLQKLVAWMDAHPEIGAASPELIDSQGKLGCPGRRLPALSYSLLELTRLHLLLPERMRAQLMLGPYSAGGDQLNVGFVPGTAMIVRREAVEKAGLLSEEVLIYGEDIEWCWRIRKAGWRIGVCSQVRFCHDEGRSTLRTWGDVERRRKMWAGLYDSCRIMRGRLYARTLMTVDMLALVIEAMHPYRSEEHRDSSRRSLRAHLALLRGRG